MIWDPKKRVYRCAVRPTDDSKWEYMGNCFETESYFVARSEYAYANAFTKQQLEFSAGNIFQKMYSETSKEGMEACVQIDNRPGTPFELTNLKIDALSYIKKQESLKLKHQK